MNLLGLQSSMQMNRVSQVTPVKQAPERTTQTEAPEKVEPKYDNYTPSQEGLDYLQAQNMKSSGSAEVSDDGISTGAVMGDPTTMPEIDQNPDAAIPDDLIDPTDFTNPDTYDPDAWLQSYYDEKANPNPNEIGPSSGATSENVPEQTVFDPSDFTNMETYDPNAWLANYRGEPVPEKSTTTVEPETSTDSVETPEESDEVEESTSSSFDLQSFLSEGESVAKDVAAYLTNATSSFTSSQDWLELLQSTKLF